MLLLKPLLPQMKTIKVWHFLKLKLGGRFFIQNQPKFYRKKLSHLSFETDFFIVSSTHVLNQNDKWIIFVKWVGQIKALDVITFTLSKELDLVWFYVIKLRRLEVYYCSRSRVHSLKSSMYRWESTHSSSVSVWVLSFLCLRKDLILSVIFERFFLI